MIKFHKTLLVLLLLVNTLLLFSIALNFEVKQKGISYISEDSCKFYAKKVEDYNTAYNDIWDTKGYVEDKFLVLIHLQNQRNYYLNLAQFNQCKFKYTLFNTHNVSYEFPIQKLEAK